MERRKDIIIVSKNNRNNFEYTHTERERENSKFDGLREEKKVSMGKVGRWGEIGKVHCMKFSKYKALFFER